MFRGEGDQRLVALDAEFLSAMTQMRVDGREADSQLFGNRLRRVPRAEPFQALLFSFGQLLETGWNADPQHTDRNVRL